MTDVNHRALVWCACGWVTGQVLCVLAGATTPVSAVTSCVAFIAAMSATAALLRSRA